MVKQVVLQQRPPSGDCVALWGGDPSSVGVLGSGHQPSQGYVGSLGTEPCLFPESRFQREVRRTL